MLRGALFVLLLSAAPVAYAQDTDIEGRYAVEGANPGDGSVYRGEAQVVRSGDAWQVMWRIGNQEHQGTGLLRDDSFAVVYQPGEGSPGVALYRLQPNGSLSGTWVGLGTQQAGSEIWNPKDRL